MHNFLNLGILVVGFILGCCGWLVWMFFKAWEYWDRVEHEGDTVLRPPEISEWEAPL